MPSNKPTLHTIFMNSPCTRYTLHLLLHLFLSFLVTNIRNIKVTAATDEWGMDIYNIHGIGRAGAAVCRLLVSRNSPIFDMRARKTFVTRPE